MSKLSNSKIEERAVTVLSNIVSEHSTMQAQFNSMDKEPSRDGYIWIYKELNGQHNKKNIDDKVPVQIKGHIDEKNVYMNRKSISYSVSIEDLEVYGNDRGVIYFQVFMSEDGTRREIFYTSLFPTKIKYYLDKARKKGNKKSINISFTKLDPKAENLYAVVKQFSNESKKQGFGTEQIVQNAIKQADIKKVKEITASVVGATNEYEFMQKLGTGDVSLYGKIEGNPFSIPFEWTENAVYYITKQTNVDICVGGRKFYESYKIRAGSNEELIIYPSGNIQMELNTGKFNFTPRTDIKTLRHDAEFLLAGMQNTEFVIGGCPFRYSNPKIPEELRKNLEFYIALDKLLTKIGFEYLKAYNEISSAILKKFEQLVLLEAENKSELHSGEAESYNLVVDGKCIPIIVFRDNESGKNEILNAIYTEKYQTYVFDEEGKNYRVPMFVHLDKHILKNLYKYDAEIFEKQILNSEINKVTEETMNLAGLNLIHAYDGDRENNSQFLKMAEELYNKLIGVFGGKNIYTINLLQIKKRMGELDKTEIKALENMRCIGEQEKYAKFVLTDQKEKARQCYEQMKESEKEELKKYPIYTLYVEMQERY